MHVAIVLLFISYFSIAYQLFSVGTYGITFVDIFAVTVYMVFLKKTIWDGESLEIAPSKHWFFFIMFIVAIFLSGISPLMDTSKAMGLQYIKTTAHMLLMLPFAAICGTYKIEMKTWNAVIKAWLIIGLLINIFGIYQIVARAYDLPLAWLEYTNVSLTGRGEVAMDEFAQLSLKFGNFYRATSIFPEPSALASFNIFMVSFLLIPFIQNKKPFFKSRFLTLFMFIMTLAAMFLTFSLTGVIGITLIFASVIFFDRNKRVFSLFGIAAAGAVIILITDTLVSSYAEISVIELFEKRISGIVNFGKKTSEVIEGESFSTRVNSAEQSIKVWESSPIVGVGLGLTALSKAGEFDFADYSVLAALSELGLVGCIAFLGLFVTLFFYVVKIYIRQKKLKLLDDTKQKVAVMAYYIMIQLIVVNFITGNVMVEWHLWMPIAIVFSIINRTLIETGTKPVIIRFRKTPLKISFNKALSRYLKSTT